MLRGLLPYSKIYHNGHGWDKYNEKGWKRGYVLNIYKHDYLKLLLDKMYPYLIGKKEVARQVLRFIDTRNREERDKIVDEIKQLNRKGVQIG